MINAVDFNGFKINFQKGMFTGQRFGQAFCNFFYSEIGRGDHTLALFYTEDQRKAEDIIWREFITQ